MSKPPYNERLNKNSILRNKLASPKIAKIITADPKNPPIYSKDLLGANKEAKLKHAKITVVVKKAARTIPALTESEYSTSPPTVKPLKNPKAAKDAILVLSELAHMVPNKEANNMMAENM